MKNDSGNKKMPRRERENFFTPICYFTGFHVAVAVVVVTAKTLYLSHDPFFFHKVLTSLCWLEATTQVLSLFIFHDLK